MDPALAACLEIDGFNGLSQHLGWSCTAEWCEHWSECSGLNLAQDVWPNGVQPSWIASAALPLLSHLERLVGSNGRQVVGLSAMAGCGKTTLCSWLEAASAELGFSVAVVSLDDFYYEAEQLDQAMHGNPWQAPRGVPGSHDTDLLAASLHHWLDSGVLEHPCFDKSLRDGRGDRSGFKRITADIVLIEGWFLGVQPWPTSLANGSASGDGSELLPQEQSYRDTVWDNLHAYRRAWQEIHSLWHFRSHQLTNTRAWKRQQNESMYRSARVRLEHSDLERFVRMLEVCIPEAALLNIDQAEVVFSLDQGRSVKRVVCR